MKLIGFHPDADAEVTEAARYYAVRKSGLGSDLLGEVERALSQILTNPEASKANRPESAAEVLVAVSLQSNLRCLSRSDSNLGVCSPETTTFLLAKSAKGHGNAGRLG